jgi:hypothetical protein
MNGITIIMQKEKTMGDKNKKNKGVFRDEEFLYFALLPIPLPLKT